MRGSDQGILVSLQAGHAGKAAAFSILGGHLGISIISFLGLQEKPRAF